jgi:hypothetical protein
MTIAVDPAALTSRTARDSASAGLGQRGPQRVRRVGERLRTEGAVVFLACLTLYLVCAYLLAYVYLSFPVDAVSRMANGFYVLYSRDPHLAAIGFVWNPGQSIADMVPLLFNPLWSGLASHDMAGSIVSALAMAGTAYQLLATLREWGVRRTPRLVMVTCFALNPMILFYGANGMSEALFLFTLVACGRYLLRWLRTGDVRSLVYSAVALGACYLVRNEALGAAMLGAPLVWGASFWGNPGERRSRMRGAMADLTIFELPFVVSVVAWLTASYVITGSPFEQFTSTYGNSTQEKFLAHKNLDARLMYELHAMWYLAPLLVIAAAASLYLAKRHRDLSVLVPLAIVGGGLGFDLLGYLGNTIQPYFRYFIAFVPLNVLVVGSLVTTSPDGERWSATKGCGGPPVKGAFRGHRVASVGALVMAAAFLAPPTLTTGRALLKQENQSLGPIFHSHLTPGERAIKAEYPAEITMSRYIESLHLPDGSIVADNANSGVCIPGVITMIDRPKVFVIPNDRSYQRTLTDPLAFDARYILEADPIGLATVTSTNVAFPGLWRTGAGFATRMHSFYAGGPAGCGDFRLFRVYGHPSLAGGSSQAQAGSR